MSPVDKLLSRLEAVRSTGSGRWSARCPAHGDKSPSLSVRELDDDRVLLRCFAGCDAADVVGAVGLDLADLFPVRAVTRHHVPRERRPFSLSDLVRFVTFEATVLCVIGADIAAGRSADLARALAATGRLNNALEVLNDARH